MSWITEHWQEIVQVVTGAVTLASIIVRWTPTIKDDGILLQVVKFLGKWIALNRTTNDNEIRSKVE